MKFIRYFFYYTRIFWFISRLFLVFAFGYCGFFLLEGAYTADYISAGFFALVALGFLGNFFARIFREDLNNWIGKLLGCFLIPIVWFPSNIELNPAKD